MLRIDVVQLLKDLGDPVMGESWYHSVAVQRFVGLPALGLWPDKTTILNFRYLLERHALGEGLLGEILQYLAVQGLRRWQGTIVDAANLDTSDRRRIPPRRGTRRCIRSRRGNNGDSR